MKASLLSRTSGRLADALARFLAEPISRPAATGDMLALSALLHPGDVLLTEGNTRAAVLVRRDPLAGRSDLSAAGGRRSRCIVEANISAGVRAVRLGISGIASLFRPLGR
jgi:hypothetical protein